MKRWCSNGTTTSRNHPAQIGSENKWTWVASGVFHTVAIKSDGTIWSWGANNRGGLGDGTITDRNIPVKIGLENTWVGIAAGGFNTLAIKPDGTLWAWGDNGLGQLGDGNWN